MATEDVVPLVYFTHADLKSKENLKASLELVDTSTTTNGESLKRHTSKLDSSKLRKRLKLTIQDDNMNYEAFEEQERPFFVGVLNKSNGKINVCNTSYFVLKPECYLSKNETQSSMTSDANGQQASTSASYADKLNMLTAAFGSSKKRKIMQTKLKNKIDSDTLEAAVSAAVEESKKTSSSTTNTNENDDAESSLSLEEYSILPVPNKEAKSPNEVYALFDTLSITKSEFDRFTLEQSKKFAILPSDTIKKWKEQNLYSEYVCNHLLDLVNSSGNQQYKVQKCKLLAYMNYLLMLYRLKSAQLRTKAPLNSSEVPESAIQKLFGLYTVVSNANAQSKNIRSMPRRLKDKLTCHILILSLHIDDFNTNLETFQKDLKLSIQRLSDFYQALGCYIKSKVTTINGKRVLTKSATLSLPLNDVSKVNGKKRSRNS